MLHGKQTIVRMNFIRRLITLVLAVVLAACSGSGKTVEPPGVHSSTEPTASTANLEDTEWVLTSLNGSSLLEGTNITLNFTDGFLEGFAGCNAYGGGRDSGKYTAADGGILTIAQIAITLQDCHTPEGIMQQEATYVEALRDAAAYQVADDRLEISNAADETTLVFARKREFVMNPDDLVGTAWQLALMNGRNLIEGSTITLAFHNEYQVSGHAGCRGYVATYEASGDDISFPSFAMMGDICTESEALMEQEGEYTTILGWATDYRLSEEPALSQPKGQLEILTARGEVLVFEPLPEDANAGLETAWILIAFIEEKRVEESATPLLMPTDLLAETEITATFEDGTVKGSAGCNTYSAAYTFDGSSLTLETIAVTEMACLDPTGVMEQERRYLDVLKDVTHCHIHGNRLWLETHDGRALVFTVRVAGYDLTNLIEDLRAAGLTVEPTEQLVDHGFVIKGRQVLVDGAPIFVYEFTDTAAAETASVGVSADKYSMTITREEGGVTVEVHSDWIETPHLYKKGRLIVISGDNSDVLNALGTVLGPQLMPASPPVPPTATPLVLTATPIPPTLTPEGLDCTSSRAFPTEDAEIVWPELIDIQPAQVTPGDKVEINAMGGYLYWNNECGTRWDESARTFQLYFDDTPVSSILCYVNYCETDLTVPGDVPSGTHTISVEGGSSLSIEVSGN
jgi:heat shock protein HslJ